MVSLPPRVYRATQSSVPNTTDPTKIGSSAWNADLTVFLGTICNALSQLDASADKVAYFTGASTASFATLTSFGRSLIAATDAAGARTVLGLDAGTISVAQLYDASANGRSLISAADYAAMRTLLAVAPLASPALTGTPTAPTAAGGTNTTQIATTAFVASALAGASLVSSIAGNVGAFTLAGGIKNATNEIQLDGAYTGFAVGNGTLAVSASAGALTIALKDNSGSDPSATSPVLINLRNATAASGPTSLIRVTAASSLVVPSGATLGVSSSTAFRLWVVGFNDAGTFRLGVVNCSDANTIYPLNEGVPASSTAVSGSSNSAGVIYTGSAVTGKAYRILGYIEWGPSGVTAGTWTTTNVVANQPFGPGIKRPGEVLQVVRTVTSGMSTGTTTIPLDNTIPQNTEGDQYMSQAVTPSSAANLLRISASACLSHSASGAAIIASLLQDSTANALAAIVNRTPASFSAILLPIIHQMRAGTTSSTTFKIRAGSNSAGTTTFNGENGAALMGGSMNSYMQVEELMG